MSEQEKKHSTPPAKSAAPKADGVRLPASNPWSGAWKISAGVGLLGIILAGVGYGSNADRFAFGYLFGFEVTLTIALGATFFVLIQHLTSSGWSVTVRRTAEFFSYGLVIMALLFAPVWIMKDRLFPWIGKTTGEHHAALEVSTTTLTSQEHSGQANATAEGHDSKKPATEAVKVDEHGAAAHAGNTEHQAANGHGHATAGGDPLEAEEHHIMQKKGWWLELGFFNVRALIYFIVWAALGYLLFSKSVSQDASKSKEETKWLKMFAAPGTILFGLSLTFAGFDWVMSLQPMWFSTIFGVYMFAGAVVSSLAVIILVTIGLRKTGILEKEINVEHFHDLGKLMFGFNVFWAYIGFSQFMLIWYAALPEETPFYHARWYTDTFGHHETGWRLVSLGLVAFHFVLPFLFLISRNVKRRLQLLPVGAIIILVMHMVDVYWLVMPNVPHYDLSGLWIDLACLCGVAGIYGAFVFYQFTAHSLIPSGDPRLARALHFENA